MQGRQPRLQRSAGTHAIILAPTRELCIQISDVLALILRRYHYLVSCSLRCCLVLQVCRPSDK